MRSLLSYNRKRRLGCVACASFFQLIDGNKEIKAGEGLLGESLDPNG